jgi:hypothetical protein
MSRSVVAVAALAAGVLFSAAGQAATIEVIYTKYTGHPTAVVPGAIDLAGNPEVIEFRDIRNIAINRDGSQWMLDATTMIGALTQSNRDSIYLKGSGTTGTMFVQESQPMPAGGTGFISFMGSGFAKFNDNNELVIGLRARNVQDGTTSSASPSDGQRTFRWSQSSGFTAGPKQGDAYNGGSGGVIGNSFSTWHILNDGTIGAADTTVNGSSTIQYLFYQPVGGTNNVFRQRNVSTVLDVDGVTPLTINTITSSDPSVFHTTPDGAHYYFKSTIAGAATTEDVMWVYDDQARLREGRVIPGSSPAFTVGDVFQAYAIGNHWITRGRDNSGTAAAAPDFVVVNGALVAKTGDPITPGSTELWGDTFLAVTINANGDYIVIGNTNNANTQADTVMVVNGTTVVAREGDMVDLNQNGVNDDDAFIGRASGTAFDANDVHLGTNGMAYFIAHIRNAAGVDLGISPTAFLGSQAFMRVQAVGGGNPCPGNVCGGQDFNGDGDFGTDQDIEAFFACLGGNCCATCFCQGSDFNGDGDFGTDADIEAFFRVLGGGNC